ncbi:phosphoribosylanthranilate isomerase [Ectothiorhodospiraceae bacterium BW-2]|nr:phosphoribosylanthranilate isomerase [Ectothiorhodospiraceae bacterium BW-2]
MSRVHVKICGITRPEDGLFAAACGVDAIGLVFYPPSPRAVTLEQAAAVVARLPPFVSVVALLVNPTVTEVEAVLAQIAPDILQFHGQESDEFCRQFQRRYIKALAVQSGSSVVQLVSAYPEASALLLDAWHPKLHGGSGEAFDWGLIPPLTQPLILAGGLNPDNVATAIATVHPYAVDVSSGVESRKGCKDHTKISRFLTEVEQCNVNRV